MKPIFDKASALFRGAKESSITVIVTMLAVGGLIIVVAILNEFDFIDVTLQGDSWLRMEKRIDLEPPSPPQD